MYHPYPSSQHTASTMDETHICSKVVHEFIIIYYKWKVEVIVMHNLKSFYNSKRVASRKNTRATKSNFIQRVTLLLIWFLIKSAHMLTSIQWRRRSCYWFLACEKREDEIIFRMEAIKGFINCCDFNLNVLRLFFRCSFCTWCYPAILRFESSKEGEWAKDKGKSF